MVRFSVSLLAGLVAIAAMTIFTLVIEHNIRRPDRVSRSRQEPGFD
jgi:hypothetical protein